jgi:uncharacterized protein YoxC
MNKLFLMINCIFFIAIFTSCNNESNKIKSCEKDIAHAEENAKGYTTEDWKKLEEKMDALQKDIEINRDKYTDEQIKEIGKLQGRYFAIAVKKGINDFQESVEDLGNQMEGFIEGITDTTKNK